MKSNYAILPFSHDYQLDLPRVFEFFINTIILFPEFNSSNVAITNQINLSKAEK